MSDPEHLQTKQAPDGVELSLWHDPEQPRDVKAPQPVLLLHGASASHRTFLVSGSGRPEDCLVSYLRGAGFDPWLLNWRGSGLVVDSASPMLAQTGNQFDFDNAAKYDVPAALELIHKKTGANEIFALGHCMGAATLAQAIAGGHAGPEQRLTRVVLLALGLFYEPAWDGRLKGQDHVLDRLKNGASPPNVVDPRPGCDWPIELLEIYDNWPSTLRPHPKDDGSQMQHMCNRVSFMYGPPYLEDNLPERMHEGDFLKEQFGAIPLHMYLHGAKNVQRGWAAKFDADNANTDLIDHTALDLFHALKSVTLMTGAQNQLWHRDSIDRMYDWLRRGARRESVHKVILPGYGNQDMLWGQTAHLDVFPRILDGLR